MENNDQDYNNSDKSSACVAASSFLTNQLYEKKNQKTMYEVTSSGIAPKKMEFSKTKDNNKNHTVLVKLKSFAEPILDSNKTNNHKVNKSSQDALYDLGVQINNMERRLVADQTKNAFILDNNIQISKNNDNFNKIDDSSFSRGHPLRSSVDAATKVPIVSNKKTSLQRTASDTRNVTKPPIIKKASIFSAKTRILQVNKYVCRCTVIHIFSE